MNYLRLLQARRGLRYPEGDPGDPNPAPNPEPNPEPNPDPAKPSFGDLLKDSSFQSDIDKYVEKALTTAKTK